MPGFNYGGYGDGTSWSSERGSTPPGGGSTGNAGNRDTGGSYSPNGEATAEQEQLDKIRSNPEIRKKLTNLILAARRINPYAKLTIQSLSEKGVLSISVTELTAEQAGEIGLSGLIVGVDASGTKLAIGDFPTGIHRFKKNQLFDHNSAPAPVEIATTGSTDLFTYDPKSGTYTSTKRFANAGTIKSLKITGPFTYRLYLDTFPGKPIDVTVNNGDPNNISVKFNDWKGPTDNTRGGVQKLIKEFIEFKLNEEKKLLTDASDVIVSAGGGISKVLGDKYKNLANEIASNIKNFQGKTIRNIDSAMVTLNKVLSNPKMKIKAGDKEALKNALAHLNAQDMAYKFGFLGKAFSYADIATKVDKLRKKTMEAIDTDNWKPVLLEVESWVLSGLATGFALSILASLAPIIASTVGLPVSAVIVLGGIGIALAASLIDDKLADKINNWLISPAY
ncbi:colicin-like pore-forming protein [Enterobacter hormaechei]|uniref:colicin-like pore-forming protein n=1 Tax=Enterobacter hormaechei TaxID=158836 RepID=UPI00263B5AFC|nr:colicin-like pore-forming protein [Enterobacter hormaechei]MDN4977657.1 colicin-like pore-forming protein [Enterobacter hormaechei]